MDRCKVKLLLKVQKQARYFEGAHHGPRTGRLDLGGLWF